MSESNKKKITVLQLILIYFIIAAIITGILIFLRLEFNFQFNKKTAIADNIIDIENDIKEQKNVEKTKKDVRRNSDKVKKLEISDKYYVNNLDIKMKTMTFGEQADPDIPDTNIINASYSQISGLKNKEIEEKINKEIYEEIEKICKQYENDDKCKRADVSAMVIGNFSDVLSLDVSVYAEYQETENSGIETKYYYDGLNYILETGEKIKFNELFLDDTSIKSIISKVAYESLAYDYLYEGRANEYEYFDGNMDNVDYSDIEDKLFKIMSEYNLNNDIKFNFSATNINMILDSRWIPIVTEDIREDIAIFSRFLADESLYENGNLPKANYACNYDYYSESYIYDEVSDNVFMKLYLNSNEEETENSPESKAYADKLVSKIISSSDNNKAYFCDLLSNYYTKDTWNAEGIIYEFDKEYYDEKKDEIILGLSKEVDAFFSEDTKIYFDKEKVLIGKWVRFVIDENREIIEGEISQFWPEIIETEEQVEEETVETYEEPNLNTVTNEI